MNRLIIPVLLILSACSTGVTLTQTQATARVEQLIRETADSLDPKPRLELIPYSVTPNPCSYSENGIPERFTVSRAYWLRGVSKTKPLAIAEQVKKRWQEEGHVITSTGGFEVGHPSIGGKSQPDGYTLALVWAEGDNLYLAATSPCIWPNGTPEPAAR